VQQELPCTFIAVTLILQAAEFFALGAGFSFPQNTLTVPQCNKQRVINTAAESNVQVLAQELS
jgi:hypothetical protein